MEYEIQKHLHYAGIPSFNRYPVTRELDGVDIAIMGVPFDSGVTNRPGARLGPRAIRNMSQLTNCFAYPWDYKLSQKAKIIDYGDVGYYVGADATRVMLEATYEHAKKILDAGCKLLTLGGDHTIPYGMVRATSEKYGKLALLHFDSHQDSTPTTDGNVSHANFAYDLQAEGCIDPSHSAQVFIRTEMTECGYNIFLANDTIYGLAGAVFTNDATKAIRVIKEIRAGITWVNCYNPAFSEAPWGGYKMSGIGRELGVH